MWKKVGTYLGLYAVLAAAALPLWFRLVPPNRFYGFRLPGTAGFSELWYDINVLGAETFIPAMLLCAAVNLLFLRRELERLLPYLGWINAALIALSFWIVTRVLIMHLPA